MANSFGINPFCLCQLFLDACTLLLLFLSLFQKTTFFITLFSSFSSWFLFPCMWNSIVIVEVVLRLRQEQSSMSTNFYVFHDSFWKSISVIRFIKNKSSKMFLRLSLCGCTCTQVSIMQDEVVVVESLLVLWCCVHVRPWKSRARKTRSCFVLGLYSVKIQE